jgi:hypothetical protein
MDDVHEWCGESHITVNDLIYAALDRVARDFLEHIVKSRSRHFACTDYTIFTNYLDSHLWFDDSDLNRWFESWQVA